MDDKTLAQKLASLSTWQQEQRHGDVISGEIGFTVNLEQLEILRFQRLIEERTGTLRGFQVLTLACGHSVTLRDAIPEKMRYYVCAECFRLAEAAKAEPCPDCIEAAKHAYSDATTPGFFYSKCERHRDR